MQLLGRTAEAVSAEELVAVSVTTAGNTDSMDLLVVAENLVQELGGAHSWEEVVAGVGNQQSGLVLTAGAEYWAEV